MEHTKGPNNQAPNILPATSTFDRTRPSRLDYDLSTPSPVRRFFVVDSDRSSQRKKKDSHT